MNADVDDVREKRSRRGGDDFFEELADPIEHPACVVGVDGGDAAGVACVPGLGQLEGGRPSPDLSDHDSIGPRAKRVEDGPLPTVDRLLDEDLELVLGGALQLPHVLDDVEAVRGLLGDLVKDGVRQRGLAAARGAAHEDVGAVSRRPC